jgi:transketolase C-terminal domain/subunit
VAVFSMGGTVEAVMDAVDELGERGIDPTVVNLSSLPVDADAVRAIAGAHPAVFVIEDHHVVGGIADELAPILLSMAEPPRVKVWGVPDYGQAAAPDELYARYRLDRSSVVDHLVSYLQSMSLSGR